MLPYCGATVLKDNKSFAALEEEWEDLYCNCPRATPFQSWAWLYLRWEAYGEDYELCLITVRSIEKLLVGVIPLMLERRCDFRRLLFIGTGLTDYLDILVRERWEGDVCEAGAHLLERLDGWRIADLQQLRPEAATWSIFRQWNGLRTSVWQDSSPIIDVKFWDEVVASLSKTADFPRARR
jgi:CelD/BcsL family acetyltransferase involved in cellulose biosynthesis